MSSRVPDWQVAAQAADWAARIDGGPLTAEERASLAQWLKASPVHVDELLFSASIMAGLAHVDADRELSIEDLLAGSAPEVIPLFHGSEGSSFAEPDMARDADDTHFSPGRLITRYWPALAASVCAVMTLSWYALSPRPVVHAEPDTVQTQVFATTAGGEQPFSLDDGSVLYMNVETRARVAFSEKQRLVELLTGEALFDVAHDADRPFRVSVAGTLVEAVGTKFTVEHGNGNVIVMVLEGEVLLSRRSERAAMADNASTGSQPTRLAAGQKAQMLKTGAPRVAEVDLHAPGAWQTNQLSFQNEDLSSIASEFNRYNATKIVIEDANLADTRFSGVFDAHDPESFIAFLALSADIRVVRPHAGQVVLSAD